MKFDPELEKIIANSRLVAIDLNSEYISSFHFLIATLKSNNIPQKYLNLTIGNFKN